jgi:NADH-quinone oxidoreductase subunit G
VFLAEGTGEQPAGVLTDPLARVRRIGGPARPEPSAVPVQVTPAAEGLAEMPPSAPLPIPPREPG